GSCLEVVEVEVPRIPTGRVVIVELQKIARPAQHLTPRFLVPDRGQQPALIPLDSQHGVLHGPTRDADAVCRVERLLYLPTAWRRFNYSPAAIHVNHLATRM